MRLGYLGPKGTFSEQAAIKFSKTIEECEFIPFDTIWEALEGVNIGKIDKGIVPIENSTEGIINITIDSMVFEMNLFIEAQINMPIEHNIMIKKGHKADCITKILSHPQAIAQCRQFLRKNYPNVDFISMNSTAEAGKLVMKSDEPLAAIGLKRVADIYNLDIIHEGIQDSNKNFTQFIIVTKTDTSSHKKGNKVSVAFSTPNEPGRLSRALNLFEVWGLNLTRIVSRPIKEKNGEYIFFADLEGGESIEDLEQCISMLKRKTSFFKNLGSYPILY